MLGRAQTAMLVGLVIVIAPLAGPTASAYHTDAPTLYEDTRDEAASWGLTMDQAEEDDIQVHVTGDLPVEKSRLTVGVVFFDEDQNWQVIAAFTALASPDRNVVRPAPETGSDVEPTVLAGDPGALEDVSFDVTLEDQGPGVASTCPGWFCATITLQDRAPGEHHLITWMAGVSATSISVDGNGLADVDARQGDAVTVGDVELPAGTANVQFQETHCDERTEAPSCPAQEHLGASYDVKVGAKALADVDVPFEAQDRAWGFWQIVDVKLVCQFTVGVCPGHLLPQALYSCNVLVGLVSDERCSRADISWDGPGDHGEDGPRSLQPIEGAPAGSYTFTVDRMVDAWGPRIYEPDTTSFVFAGEYFTTLTLADVQLPAS